MKIIIRKKIISLFLVIITIVHFTSCTVDNTDVKNDSLEDKIHSDSESSFEVGYDNIQYFGNTVACGKDNGYEPLEKTPFSIWTDLYGKIVKFGDNDPHFGWSLGDFYIAGFSSKIVNNSDNCYGQPMTVFLKNAGDQLSFGYQLKQDIDALNGDSSLLISNDHKVVADCYVKDPEYRDDFGRGVLLIEFTDFNGNKKLIPYIDFLSGCQKNANTEVELFEEGDYRVVLCYEVYDKHGINWISDWYAPGASWFNYRTEAYFSVRNSNSMIYLFDRITGSELKSNDHTQNGFRVDLANSKYLQINIKRETCLDNSSEYIEDTRFNAMVSDGYECTMEGKYTITVKNIYTGAETTKIIFIDSSNINQ